MKMTMNERRFLSELANLFELYSIDEVGCEEIAGEKYITFHSNGRILAFRLYDGIYHDIMMQIMEFDDET